MSDRSDRLMIAFAVVAAVVFVGGAVALAGLTLSDTAVADVAVNNFAVPDESTEAEQLDTVSFFWAGGISWSDTPEPVESVDIAVSAEDPDGNMQELLSFTCSHEDPHDECGFDSATEGSQYQELEVGLIMHGDWTSEHFSPPEGGEVSHTIEVRLDTEVNWDGGSITESASDTTTITVTHPDDGEEETATPEEEQSDPEAFIDFGTATVTLG